MLENVSIIARGFETESLVFQNAFFAALIECNDKLIASRDWRTHERLVKQFASLHSFCPPALVMDKLVTLLFDVMSGNYVVPVKEAALGSLCHVLYRGVKTLSRRRDVCGRLIQDYSKGTSYWKRLLFLRFAEYVSRVFSRRLFKETFWNATLDLAQDPVSIVRIRACGMLPLLKGMIVLPGEASLLRKLNGAIAKLRGDNSSDVAEEALAASEKLNRIECPVEKFPTDEDLKDLNRELHEEEMFDKEQAEIDEAKHREETERADVWRRMAEREAEISKKAKIYGRLPKSKLGRIKLPGDIDQKPHALITTPLSTPLYSSSSSSASAPPLSPTKQPSAGRVPAKRSQSFPTRMPPLSSSSAVIGSGVGAAAAVVAAPLASGSAKIKPAGRGKPPRRHSPKTRQSSPQLSSPSESPRSSPLVTPQQSQSQSPPQQPRAHSGKGSIW
jgi:hypothetical protein